MTTTDITNLPESAFAFTGTCAACGQLVSDGRRVHRQCDTTLVKSTRPATCAVCREVVTGSIVLPTEEHVCGACCCIALRNMIDDAAACRGTR